MSAASATRVVSGLGQVPAPQIDGLSQGGVADRGASAEPQDEIAAPEHVLVKVVEAVAPQPFAFDHAWRGRAPSAVPPVRDQQRAAVTMGE
jgi:hypothetical protein